MKKILPAAASIIALTATISFASERKVDDAEYFFRVRVVERDSTNNSDDNSENLLSNLINGKIEQFYRIEIERGNKTRVVLINAYSGRILSSTEETVKNSVPLLKSS